MKPQSQSIELIWSLDDSDYSNRYFCLISVIPGSSGREYYMKILGKIEDALGMVMKATFSTIQKKKTFVDILELLHCLFGDIDRFMILSVFYSNNRRVQY